MDPAQVVLGAQSLPVIPAWVHLVVLAAVVLLATWKGGRDERIAAFGYGAINVVTLVVLGPFQNAALELLFTLLSAGLFTLLLVRGNRWWLMAACSLAMFELVIAVAYNVRPFGRWTFATAELVCMYLILALIASGTWMAWRDNRRANAEGALPI